MNDKLKAYRDNLSQEDKDNLLAQARVARKEAIAVRDGNTHLLKTEWLDSNMW